MNLNMQAFNINTLLGGLDKVRDVMGVYQQQLLLIVIVFALLNCFFGYALRKLWSVIPGFFLGAAAGYAAGTYTNQTTTITLALAVGTGLLTAIIAFVLYRIGLFLLICGLVGFCLWHLVNPNDTTGYGLVALVAFVIGLICVPPAPKPEKKSNIGMILVIFALAGAAGAAYYYIKFVKGRKPKDEDLDFFDDEGYEEEPYINEDEEPQIAVDEETDGDED